MELLLIFIALNIVNVILQTFKSIWTITRGKVAAALINAIAYGFYTIIVVYMVSDLNLYLKMGVVGACNLIGVFTVKFIEEKKRKDKIWRIELTVKTDKAQSIANHLTELNMSYSAIPLETNYTVFAIYCKTQKESSLVKSLVEKYNAKFFIAESKTF